MHNKKTTLAFSTNVNSQIDYFQSFEFLENVINTSPNLVFVKDITGRFTLANKAVAEIYGTTVEGLVGKRDADFNTDPEEVDWYSNDDQQVILEKKTIIIPEEKVTSPDGTIRWFETTKKPILTKNGEYQVLGVATDITERKKLFEQLLQAQKMQSLGRLAGGIAHDFNNLLTVILGHVSLLEESEYPQHLIPKSVDGIKNTTMRAADLVKKILGFAREGKHLNVEIDLHEIVTDTISMLSRTIDENIKIASELLAENSFIKGDPIQVQQVLMNLIINARDAMTSEKSGTNGGSLLISTQDINYNFQNGVKLSIQDTGCGMDETTKARIFDPFFTTKTSGHGLGLGLSMVYGIIDNHQGSLSVESEIGVGTTFELSFPSSESDPKICEESSEMELKEQAPLQVLLVDDNIYVLKTTAESLKSLHHQVTITSSAEEALNYLASKSYKIDLLILDIVMPNLNTAEFIKSALQLDPKLQIILSTGYDLNTKVKEYQSLGIKYFLQKPYDKTFLDRTIRKAMIQK